MYENGNTRWRSIFAFASVGLVKGGYVTKQRGVWAITDQGRAVANAPYDNPAFLAELNRHHQAWKGRLLATPNDLDAPESPAFFERLVVQLLVTMGYGGNRANAGQVTQPSADNGIDSFINEDLLGLDTIYLQANKSDPKIVLIEDARLAALMIEHNLGVSVPQSFSLKRLDTDFFAQD